MRNTITAQEIKRGGINAVDARLAEGAVHVITRKRTSAMVVPPGLTVLTI